MVTEVVYAKGGQFSVCAGVITDRSEYYCLSTDTKPSEGVNNADVLYEIGYQEGVSV